MNDTTTNEVITTLNDAVESVETNASELAGGVRAVVPDKDIGRVMGVLRRSALDFEATRDPSGENLIININAVDESVSNESEPESESSESDQQGLGELFR